jgi:hypothetical protein
MVKKEIRIRKLIKRKPVCRKHHPGLQRISDICTLLVAN